VFSYIWVMGTLGQRLLVALVAAAAGSLAGFSGSASEANRPIVQTIAASQPTRIKPLVFRPSANPEPAPARIAEPIVKASTEIIPRSDVAQPARTAPVTRASLGTSPSLDVASGLGEEPAMTSSARPSGAALPNQKPLERSRKRPSARFGQSEIVDPWSSAGHARR
jgi:hypothetical protein